MPLGSMVMMTSLCSELPSRVTRPEAGRVIFVARSEAKGTRGQSVEAKFAVLVGGRDIAARIGLLGPSRSARIQDRGVFSWVVSESPDASVRPPRQIRLRGKNCPIPCVEEVLTLIWSNVMMPYIVFDADGVIVRGGRLARRLLSEHGVTIDQQRSLFQDPRMEE